VTTPTPATPNQPARVPQVSTLRPGKTTDPSPALRQAAQIQRALNDQKKLVRGPLVEQPANAARLAAILHLAAMDLWDVATEQDQAQMWEEARAIASRILAACPSA